MANGPGCNHPSRLLAGRRSDASSALQPSASYRNGGSSSLHPSARSVSYANDPRHRADAQRQCSERKLLAWPLCGTAASSPSRLLPARRSRPNSFSIRNCLATSSSSWRAGATRLSYRSCTACSKLSSSGTLSMSVCISAMASRSRVSGPRSTHELPERHSSASGNASRRPTRRPSKATGIAHVAARRLRHGSRPLAILVNRQTSVLRRRGATISLIRSVAGRPRWRGPRRIRSIQGGWDRRRPARRPHPAPLLLPRRASTRPAPPPVRPLDRAAQSEPDEHFAHGLSLAKVSSSWTLKCRVTIREYVHHPKDSGPLLFGRPRRCLPSRR